MFNRDTADPCYLEKIQRHKQVQLNELGMNALLDSHLIRAETLRIDDFDAFYADRKSKLLALIESVMGKQALGPPDAETLEDGKNKPSFLITCQGFRKYGALPI